MTNLLAKETSSYLQQHGENPVDWYPWNSVALDLAQERDLPILLSIGYSACHWCHVMEAESFSDSTVAADMNRWFVNIKVDREERPDLDFVYQRAHQSLTGRGGGWPLTVFLTPQGEPFFAGTYFPKEPRYGMPGFPAILAKVAEAYRLQKKDIHASCGQLKEFLQKHSHAQSSSHFSPDLARRTLEEFKGVFDHVHAGMGESMKFPHAMDLSFCLTHHSLDASRKTKEHVFFSLDAMAEGGLYDHLQGGFFRYCTDRQWRIPHFEKMLYDQALLIRLYGEGYALSHNENYRSVLIETARWLEQKMSLEEGGFCASLDADAAHEEGSYYLWDLQEAKQLLTTEEQSVLLPFYGVDQPAEVEGRIHLRQRMGVAEVARMRNISIEKASSLLALARQKLLNSRDKRVPPGRDDKVLTSWNALMSGSLFACALWLNKKEWGVLARRNLSFIRQHLWKEGKLYATWQNGVARLDGYLDDYAFTLEAVLSQLSWEYEPELVAWAQELANAIISNFSDEQGGFFFTSHTHEKLFFRPKITHDQATPSGMAAAVFALQRLGYFLGEPHFLAAANKTLQWAVFDINHSPTHHVSFLHAVEEWMVPTDILVLRGDEEEVESWQQEVYKIPRPHLWCIAPKMRAMSVGQSYAAPQNGVAAYLCRGSHCLPPITDLADLKRQLDAPAQMSLSTLGK